MYIVELHPLLVNSGFVPEHVQSSLLSPASQVLWRTGEQVLTFLHAIDDVLERGHADHVVVVKVGHDSGTVIETDRRNVLVLATRRVVLAV